MYGHIHLYIHVYIYARTTCKYVCTNPPPFFNQAVATAHISGPGLFRSVTHGDYSVAAQVHLSF